MRRARPKLKVWWFGFPWQKMFSIWPFATFPKSEAKLVKAHTVCFHDEIVRHKRSTFSQCSGTDNKTAGNKRGGSVSSVLLDMVVSFSPLSENTCILVRAQTQATLMWKSHWINALENLGSAHNGETTSVLVRR